MKNDTPNARESFDAIVIGSGLGGLVTAAYLCSMGRRTLVLEAHYVAGETARYSGASSRGESTNSTWASTTSENAAATA